MSQTIKEDMTGISSVNTDIIRHGTEVYEETHVLRTMHSMLQ